MPLVWPRQAPPDRRAAQIPLAGDSRLSALERCCPKAGLPRTRGSHGAAASEFDMGAVNPSLKLLPASEAEATHAPGERLESLIESYRGLADVFHEVLAEQSLDTLLERIADTLADLIPYDTLTIFQVE